MQTKSIEFPKRKVGSFVENGEKSKIRNKKGRSGLSFATVASCKRVKWTRLEAGRQQFTAASSCVEHPWMPISYVCLLLQVGNSRNWRGGAQGRFQDGDAQKKGVKALKEKQDGCCRKTQSKPLTV